MRAMLLAAGRGERMRPLTDSCPKPLLRAGGDPLIIRLIRQLVAAGIHDLVINHAWLGEQIESAVGNGREFGASVQFSPEQTALETAGGIAKALPLLGSDPFLVVNADLFTDFDFSLVKQWQQQIQAGSVLGICTLVPNPAHNPDGDFALEEGLIRNQGRRMLTYAGIAAFAPAFFAPVQSGERAPLAPLLRAAADYGRLAGITHEGLWSDVGTPERLSELNHWQSKK